ncbi:hypothetical protein VC83_02122 [Pseudogymnoascus destructans]|uniref:Uncharacterized protein n=1 Tax=Pseudogymnoascus destructans TaxID=655981 RepID=A0A177AGM7_9PEZI|nr:uncharacterized protein VC83_02122 [Pseudogymnoascus destructans]OAF61255.1 hypothetical protein VC83_02122 [Pseudogymnoascus destructans]
MARTSEQYVNSPVHRITTNNQRVSTSLHRQVKSDGVLYTALREKPLVLSVVTQRQVPGEPDHWSLFVASEDEAGEVFQVKGDAQQMAYCPSDRPVQI